MANIKYFADLDGQTIELDRVQPMSNKEFAAAFPGVQGRKWDGVSKIVGQPVGFVPTYDREAGRWNRKLLPVTRSIEFKRAPSLHVCDARCINATGRIMKCECSCGGKNHGAGAFNCSAVQ